MTQHVLIIIKPDGILKGLSGLVLNKLEEARLDITALRILKVSRKLAEEHYKHLKGEPFFEEVIEYLLGKYHKNKKVLALILSGPNAINKCRKLAGATNPEAAEPTSIRGSFGRITTKGVFENVLHVSSNKEEAEREIKLWFTPEEIIGKIYKTKEIIVKSQKKKVWT